MALRKIHNTYYVYFKDIDGTQRTRSLKTTDKATAEKLHRKFMVALQAKKGDLVIMKNFPERFPQAAEVKTIAPPVIKEGDHQRGSIALAKMWECALKKKTWTDEIRMKACWDRFVKSVKVKYADQVTAKMALAYLEDNYAARSGKTYNNVKTNLNTVFRLCMVEAGLQRTPFEVIPNRQVRDVEHFRPLSEAEFIAAFHAAAEPWKSAAMISWFTALRKEACFRLAWEHIDEDSDIPSITIMPGKTARFGRAVYIPIHRQLWRYLKSLPRPASDKTPILSQFPYIANWDRKKSYFVGLLNSLGIFSSEDGKAGFHSIRGSFITRCDEQNVDRRATKGVAGQVDDYVTDLYSRDKETAKQILRLPEVDV